MVNPVTITMVNNIFSVSTFQNWLKVVRSDQYANEILLHPTIKWDNKPV